MAALRMTAAEQASYLEDRPCSLAETASKQKPPMTYSRIPPYTMYGLKGSG